jgi:hypothetical protein
MGHKDEPWVPTATVAQMFYILDPKDKKKYIVVPRNEVPFFVDTRRINIVEAKNVF